MPRPIWSGSLGFGLVNVPVELLAAERDLDYHFRQLHETDHAPIQQRRYCSKEDREIDWDEIGHGYELDDGRQVVLTDEDLEAVEPEKSRTIEIERFVGRDEIDPIMFDRDYFLVPAEGSRGTLRAYDLLRRAMERSGRIALGRFVMHTREYVAAVRERDGALALTTVHFQDEIRSPDFISPGGEKPSRKALERAVAIVEELSTEWDPGTYRDCYRERLKRVIESKADGEAVEAPEPAAEPRPSADLMGALQETLRKARDGGKGGSESAGGRGTKGDLARLSRDELYARAKKSKLPGRSKMTKRELVESLGPD